MTRKALPKAIVRPLAELREHAALAGDAKTSPAPGGAADAPFDPPPAADVFSCPPANDPAPTFSPQAERLAAKRRSLAHAVVRRHKLFAAMGGLFPLPAINIAGVTAINMRMVKQLSDLYALPFRRDRTRSMIIGLMGGAVPTGLGFATASTLAFAVPGSALVGLAVSALSAGALTEGIGRVFVEHFESVTTARDALATARR